MSETATDKLSKRWESKRVHTSDNLTSRWDRNTDDRTLERPERPEHPGRTGHLERFGNRFPDSGIQIEEMVSAFLGKIRGGLCVNFPFTPQVDKSLEISGRDMSRSWA